ncbi:hypothetical protein ACFVQ0_35780 [Streptomyces sp. NPDC057900]|uniref:hypothetical protein n=1 Tax=Streptomyces sp. NPDC057900 TaxID=3346274 RepID=UPI0036EF2E57
MLTGFREWLVLRLNRGNDLSWPALVRHLAPGGWIHPLTPQADTETVITLHQLLSEFFLAREQADGLSTIFRTYHSWLATQA